MVYKYRIMAVWLIALLLFISAGCEQRYERKDEAEDYNPLADANFVIADYAAAAIDAAGGRKAWIAAKRLDFDCVVTFYRSDGSFYLTEQRHELRPWSDSIRISATEPGGRFVWEYSEGTFRTVELVGREDVLPINVCEPYFAQAVLDIVTAPARFADGAAGSAGRSVPVKLEGRWYYPIRMGKSIRYQSRDSYLVDAIWFGAADGRFVSVRGYNYEAVQNGGVLVPTKVEVYNSDAAGSLKERLAQVDYYKLNRP
jgi:hypothetical protein